MKSKPCLLHLAICGAIGFSGQVSASQSLLEEVLVTAQKRSAAASAQDIPIAVTAYSGDQIEGAFVTSLTDIGRMAPNVQMEEVGSVAGVANFSFREWVLIARSPPMSPPWAFFSTACISA